MGQMCPICSSMMTTISSSAEAVTGKVDTIEEQLKAANLILKDLASQICPDVRCYCHDKIWVLRDIAVGYMQRWGVPK